MHAVRTAKGRSVTRLGGYLLVFLGGVVWIVLWSGDARLGFRLLLPGTLTFTGRHYHPGPARCWSRRELIWPSSHPLLIQIDSVRTWFGASYPVLSTVAKGKTPYVMYVYTSQDCYQEYGLSGGP